MNNKELYLKLKEMIAKSIWWEETDPSDSFKVYSLRYYYPMSVGKIGWDTRYMIWNFKGNDGDVNSIQYERYKEVLKKVVPWTSDVLRFYFREYFSDLTLFCIPASTSELYRNRFYSFSNQLCEDTGMENGYDKLKYIKEGKSKRLNNGVGVPCEVQLDKEFWKDKLVVMFDDLIIKGNAMRKYKQMLVDCGAYVVGGITIGMTMHEEIQPEPINWFYGYLNSGWVVL